MKKKIIKIMKLSSFLLLFTVLQVWAVDSYSQHTKLTLDLKDVTVEDALITIEDQSEFFFLYSPKMVDVSRKVDIELADKDVNFILKQMFAGTGVDYVVKDRQIVITTDEMIQPFKKETPQQIVVTGKVTDEDGNPLPGVNIIIKGTLTGTITNVDGNYSIQVDDPDATLVFSFIGYRAQEVEISGRAVINITLAIETIGLEEVVAIGYGTMKKSDLTGAVSKVSSTELVKIATSSVSQALQGRVAGVRVINNQGPGAGSTIRIRGIATINNATPLYVIDGFPTDGMNHLAPNDIESVEVLKDASATAIYGSRGANGVVLITTKTGKFERKSTVSANVFVGREKEIGRYDMLDATEYAILFEEALINDGMEPSGQMAHMMKYIVDNKYKGTDWQDEFMRPGFNQNYNVSLSGGTKNSAYDIGATYAHETGIVKRGFSEKIFLHANSDYKISDKIQVGTKINYHTSASNYMEPFDAISKEPMVPAWDSYANNYGAEVVWNNENQARILDQNADYYNNSPNRIFRAKAYLQVDDLFIKGLSFRSQFGAGLSSNHGKGYNPVYYVSGAEYNSESSLSEFRSESKSWVWSNFFTYKVESNGHNLNATLGTERQKWEFANIGVTVFNVPDNEDLFYINSAIEKERMGVSGSGNHHAMESYFTRANYNYDNRFLLTATIRRDGSSKFAKENRWGYFPSFSAGYNLMEESYMDWLGGTFRSLKVRGGWGQVGNQSSAGNNDYAGLVFTGYKTVFGNPQTIYDGAVQLNVPNPNIRWEVAEQSNIGLNFVTSNNKLMGSLDMFSRDTKDMIISKPIPYYAGQRRPKINAASMRNKGVEVELGYNGNTGSGLKYGISFNMAYIKNEVFDLPEPIMPAKSTRTEEGKPMAYFYGYQTNGIINDQAELDAYLTEVTENNNAGLGDVKFVDQITVDTDDDGIPDAKDGKIDGDDRVNIGNPWPALVGGLNFDLAYKNFDFSLFCNGEYDKDVWNEMAEKFEKTKMSGGNLLASRMGRWTPDNPNADQPRMHNGDPNQNSRANDRYIEDASFFRLTSAQLGYTLPANILQQIGISYLRLYFTCDNIYTFTNYTGLNPEIDFTDGQAIMPGFDGGTYPLLRTFTVGANIKF